MQCVTSRQKMRMETNNTTRDLEKKKHNEPVPCCFANPKGNQKLLLLALCSSQKELIIAMMGENNMTADPIKSIHKSTCSTLCAPSDFHPSTTIFSSDSNMFLLFLSVSPDSTFISSAS